MRHSLPLILLLTSSAPVFADDAPIRMDKIECQDLAGLAVGPEGISTFGPPDNN